MACRGKRFFWTLCKQQACTEFKSPQEKLLRGVTVRFFSIHPRSPQQDLNILNLNGWKLAKKWWRDSDIVEFKGLVVVFFTCKDTHDLTFHTWFRWLPAWLLCWVHGLEHGGRRGTKLQESLVKNPIAQPQPQCQIVGLFLKRFLASRERSHIPYQGTFEDFPFLKVGFVIVPCKVAVAAANGGIITGEKILSEDTASTSSNTGNKTHELLQFRFCTYSIKLGKTMYVCIN